MMTVMVMMMMVIMRMMMMTMIIKGFICFLLFVSSSIHCSFSFSIIIILQALETSFPLLPRTDMRDLKTSSKEETTG